MRAYQQYEHSMHPVIHGRGGLHAASHRSRTAEAARGGRRRPAVAECAPRALRPVEPVLEFFSDLGQNWYNTPVNIDATNVPVRAQIAKASAKDL